MFSSIHRCLISLAINFSIIKTSKEFHKNYIECLQHERKNILI